jgi:hypothetical protein
MFNYREFRVLMVECDILGKQRMKMGIIFLRHPEAVGENLFVDECNKISVLDRFLCVIEYFSVYDVIFL